MDSLSTDGWRHWQGAVPSSEEIADWYALLRTEAQRLFSERALGPSKREYEDELEVGGAVLPASPSGEESVSGLLS